MRKRTLLYIICALVITAYSHFGPGVRAQEQPRKEEGAKTATRLQGLVMQRPNVAPSPVPGSDSIDRVPPIFFSGIAGDSFMTVATEMNYSGKTIKGAPFSADAVTEFVQVLTDGNRILRTTSGSLYRDGEGRTRREQIFRPFGQMPADNPEMHRSINISDPVSNSNYMLQPVSRTAFKHQRYDRLESFNSFTFQSAPNTAVADMGSAKASGSVSLVRVAPPTAAGAPTVVVPPTNGVRKPRQATAGGDPQAVPLASATALKLGDPSAVSLRAMNTSLGFMNREIKQESLGKQTIEGVEAEGVRTVHIIPTGAIGNERPIEIVYERWFSPELQLVIMAKHSDPRAGETVYRLTNLNRAEPDASLFQVPADYQIHEPANFLRPADEPRKSNDQ